MTKNIFIHFFYYYVLRDILYQFKNVFENQAVLDRMINNLARTIDVSRSSFNIVLIFLNDN
jgi:hypothetical protein